MLGPKSLGGEEMTDSVVEQPAASALKYIGWFFLINLAVAILLGVIEELVGISTGSNGIPSLIAASLGTGYMFARKERRPITQGEKFRIALGSSLLILVFAGLVIALFVGFMPSEGFNETYGSLLEAGSLGLILAALLIIGLIQLGFIYFMVGLGARDWKKFAEQDKADAEKVFE